MAGLLAYARSYRRLLFAALHLIVVCHGPRAFAETAESFGAKKWPGAPVLSFSSNPELCRELHAAVVKEFLSSREALDISDAIGRSRQPIEMWEIEPPIGKHSTPRLLRVDFDLDGTGESQAVLLRVRPFNWKGDWAYGYVFPSVDAFSAVAEQWAGLEEQGQVPSPNEAVMGAQRFYPAALSTGGEYTNTGSPWAQPALFVHAGKFYFAMATNDFGALQTGPTPVFRLRASGAVERVCEIAQTPTIAEFDMFRRLENVASFLHVLGRIANPGPDTGTMHSSTLHSASARLAERNAAARPWVLTDHAEDSGDPEAYHRFGPRLDLFLESWGHQEPWNLREYQTLQSLIGVAAQSYANYLRARFGLDAPSAGKAASDVIQAVLAEHITIPAGFSSDEQRVYFNPQSGASVIARRDRSEFDLLLTQMRSLGGQGAYSELLLHANEWPYALDRLLELGADPNYKNGFGKTPLMFAAHFNRPDAVRKLLKAGADVSATTTAGNGYRYALKRYNRTALLYAAENAGPLVIQMLLDAGADSSVRDVKGATFADYLALNSRFTEAERQRIPNEFEDLTASEASFDCARAKATIDLAICDSEVLRVLDSEIALAYARMKDTWGKSMVEEQRAWIRARDRACGVPPDTDCLAEFMRTRARVLQLRWSEPALDP